MFGCHQGEIAWSNFPLYYWGKLADSLQANFETIVLFVAVLLVNLLLQDGTFL